MRTIEVHRVRRVMGQSRTIKGVAPPMLIAVSCLALLVWLFSHWLVALMVGGLAFAGAYKTRDDPKILHIAVHAWRMATHYDAAMPSRTRILLK